MKKICLLALVALLGLAGAWKAQATAQVQSITPHRATYRMSLLSTKKGGQIRNATGSIEYEWADACDAWATQQHMKLRFTNIDGEEREVISHVLSTESKDGKTYQFNIRRFIDGEQDNIYRGQASLSGKAGHAAYAQPKEWGDKPLPEGVMFPSAHTLLIIEKAKAGEKMFTRPVFDGSDDEGVAEVSAFISPRHEKQAVTDVPEALRSLPALAGQAWGVRLAFFNPADNTGVPDYEMELVLQPNGIARSMNIDYGDFIVAGELQSLDVLPSASCPDAK